MFQRIRKALTPPAPPPPPSPGPTRNWRVEHVVARIETLIDAKQGEDALDYFLSELGNLADSKLHRREKLNHLRFLGRMLEARTSAKHGPDKLSRKSRLIGKVMERLEMRAEGTFLDFGCGTHDPIGLATIAYASGFDRAIACDLDTAKYPVYSALSMYDILLEANVFPLRFLLPGSDRKDFVRRIGPLMRRCFATGDFAGGLEAFAGKIDYRISELTTLDIADRELGFAVSFAVLEHVKDPPEIYEWLYRKTRPGCGQFHFIDLADHRAYRGGGGYNYWSFLTEENAPPNLNRLRAQEHLALAREAGFELVNEDRVTKTIPEETRERLLPPWCDLPKEELETIGLRVMLRRPG